MRGLPAVPDRIRALQPSKTGTYLWCALFLLQELAYPPSNGGIRTLAPFLLMAAPGCLLLSAVAAIVVIAFHDFNVHLHLLTSLMVLLMPFALLSTNRIALDVELFARTVIGVLCAACLVQALFPGLSNMLFTPIVNHYLHFQSFGRATGLSMEPSFAAEMLFAVAAIHYFFAPRLWSRTTVMVIATLLMIRAGTIVQQALLFALVYLFLRCVRFVTGAPAQRHRANLLLALLAGVMALCAMLFGYSLFTYGRLDLSFIPDSIDRFNSWRTISNYAAYLSAQPISLFPYASDDGWGRAIADTLRLHRITGDQWVTQPFSAIGVAFLDLGLGGAALWVALVYAAAVRRLRPYALDTLQAAILYTLLANGIFLAPKWQSSGFLAIGLIAATIDRRNASRLQGAHRPGSAAN
jgi:hypothetical protein